MTRVFVPTQLRGYTAGASEVTATGATLDAELLVVCHHKPGEDVPLLPRMMLPQQGDTFRIDTRD